MFKPAYVACIAVIGACAQPTPPPGTPPGGVLQGPAIYKLEDALLEWPLPASERAYGAIDGKHLHEYVEDLAAISRHYRDSGHRNSGAESSAHPPGTGGSPTPRAPTGVSGSGISSAVHCMSTGTSRMVGGLLW